jgi:tetratricopeptide (TPR) repeat protein
MHPVVRAYAVGSVPPEQQEGIAQKVIDHFNSLPHPPWDSAATFRDLQNGLHVARTQLHLRRFEEAAETLIDLSGALMFNLEMYEEYLALLGPIFYEGWERPAPQLGGWKLSWMWNGVAICLGSLGHAREALKVYEKVLSLDIELDRPSDVATVMRSISLNLSYLGYYYDHYRVMQILEKFTTAASSEEERALLYLVGLPSAVRRGDFDAAERFASLFAALPRPTHRGLYRPGDYEYVVAKFHFYAGRMDQAVLADAENIATRGNNRPRIRAIHWLRGEWHLALGQWAEAASAFEEDIRMTREVNLSAAKTEPRLALAQVRLSRKHDARETADRLAELEEPPNWELAELYLALGDLEKARQYVLPAYKEAWADGEPYADWWPLQRCREVLQALGEPEPQLPKFDPANFPPIPYEVKVLEYIEKKKAWSQRT